MVGSGSGPCSSSSTATCAAKWLTPYNGLPSATASALAAATPTSSAPARPGPLVTASASTSDSRTPASRQARSTVGAIASRCARLATSGTTPPNRACSSTLLAMASASRVSPRTMPTPVSSHDVSIPSTSGSSGTATSLLQRRAQHERVDVPRLVVAAARAHDGVPAVLVERECRLVVGAHLEHDGCRATADCAALELVEQHPTPPTAPRRLGHGEGHDVRDVATVVEAGVPDHAPQAGQDDVLASWTGGELGPPGG